MSIFSNTYTNILGNQDKDVSEETPGAALESQVTEPTQEENVENTISTDTGFVSTMSQTTQQALFNVYPIIAHMGALSRYDLKADNLKSGVRDMAMVASFSKVAKTHNLSSPLVDAFRATPGFEQAVKNFPASDLYNIFPSHSSSADNVAGLESLNSSQGETVDMVKTQAQSMADAFGDVLDTIPATVNMLRADVDRYRASLEASDLTDEVMAVLPVSSLSGKIFTESLNQLQDRLTAVESFNADDLRAHPENVGTVSKNIMALVNEAGGSLGLSVDLYGFTDGDKTESYLPTQGDFGSKEITKDGLAFHLTQAGAVLDALETLASKKDEIVQSLHTSVNETPTSIDDSDDVTYSAVDHYTLMGCHTKLITKLVGESVTTVSMLLNTADAALNINDGTATA